MIQRDGWDSDLGTIRLEDTKFKLWLSQIMDEGGPRKIPYMVRGGACRSHGSHQVAFVGSFAVVNRLMWVGSPGWTGWTGWTDWARMSGGGKEKAKLSVQKSVLVSQTVSCTL